MEPNKENVYVYVRVGKITTVTYLLMADMKLSR
jgi:hypothetical protein